MVDQYKSVVELLNVLSDNGVILPNGGFAERDLEDTINDFLERFFRANYNDGYDAGYEEGYDKAVENVRVALDL